MRNEASENERDFSSERVTIHTRESKRSKFRMGVIFRFTVLYNGIVMSVASTEHIWEPSLSLISIVLSYTSTQQTWVVSGLPAVSVNYDVQPSRLVLLEIVLAYMCKIAQNVHKSFVAGAPPQTQPWGSDP